MPTSDPATGAEQALAVFFRPNGVAIIGASSEPQKLGYGIVRNLQQVHYAGPIYPVNRHEEEILGYKVYPHIGRVPDPVELAVIVVPAPAVAAELVACGQRGIKGAIIISAGFREVGPAGAAMEREIRSIATEYGIRVLGPNCIGTIDTHTPLNTTFVMGMPRSGDIAFLSQSGAMAAAVIDWAAGAGVGFSQFVSLGNQMDVSSAEMLSQIGPGRLYPRRHRLYGRRGRRQGVYPGRQRPWPATSRSYSSKRGGGPARARRSAATRARWPATRPPTGGLSPGRGAGRDHDGGIV